MAAQKDFIIEYISNLPETWDDVKFIDGYPGKFVVLARKNGNNWYIAGINGENISRSISLKVPFIDDKSEGIIITDADNANELIKRDIDFSTPLNVTMCPYGGFTIKALSK